MRKRYIPKRIYHVAPPMDGEPYWGLSGGITEPLGSNAIEVVGRNSTAPFDGVTPEMEQPEFLNAEPGNHLFYWTQGIYKDETCRE